MTTFYLPANCQLVITGPEYVQLGLITHYEQQQGYALAPTPTHAVPNLAPHMVPPMMAGWATPGMIPKVQPAPMLVPMHTPRPLPQSTPALVPQVQATPPLRGYDVPPPMLGNNQVPYLVPGYNKPPESPHSDPARAAMAAYIAARNEDAAHRKMQAELDEQVEKAMKAVSEAGVASPSAGAAMDPKA